MTNKKATRAEAELADAGMRFVGATEDEGAIVALLGDEKPYFLEFDPTAEINRFQHSEELEKRYDLLSSFADCLYQRSQQLKNRISIDYIILELTKKEKNQSNPSPKVKFLKNLANDSSAYIWLGENEMREGTNNKWRLFYYSIKDCSGIEIVAEFDKASTLQFIVTNKHRSYTTFLEDCVGQSINQRINPRQ